MNQNETFTPRQSGPAMWLGWAGERFEQYLTPISIAIVVIGLILLALGPIRGLLSDSPTTLTGNDGAISAFQVQQGVASADGPSFLERLRLDRDFSVYTTIPERPRDEVTTYTIKRGDTLFGIANLFDLNPNTIFWANSDILNDSVHLLLPGIELFILPVDGVYHRADGAASVQSIAREYEVEPEVILESPYNRDLGIDQPTDVPGWGNRVVVPGGQREIVDYEIPEVQTEDGTPGGRVISFMPGMAGSCGSFTGSGGTGAWIPPIAPGAYTLTQSFYPGHSGVDLAAVEGTPVRAADTGVVAFSGWVDVSWGYGILVVLDHGNNWTTYYAHLSANSVSCGSLVQRGATIGAVGNTGNSTGAHLHFEMRWIHTPDNPVAYIGF